MNDDSGNPSCQLADSPKSDGVMDNTKIAEAQALARDYLKLLKEWIPRRRATIQNLKDIADSLENIQFGAGVGKAAGATTAVIGGLASVVGIFATGGLATPLIVGGLLGSVAGTATSVGSDILGDQLSNNRMKEAQEELEREKSHVVEIESKKERLDEIVEEVSQSTGVSGQQVLSALLMTSVPGYRTGSGYTPTNQEIERMLQQGLFASVILGGKAVTVVLATTVPLGKVVGKTLADVSIKGFSRIAGSMLRGVAAGALLVWDFYILVKTAVDINNGNGLQAAKALKDLAAELENQTKDVETLLEDIKARAGDVGTLVRDKFRQLLISISQKGEATEAETEEVKRWMDLYACEDWKNSFTGNLNLDTFAANETFPLARVVHNLLSPIQEYLDNDEEDEENKDDELVVTVIARGSVNTAAQLPCQFYYMTPSLASITLYAPWGCAIDASVVHGICSNSMRITNARYNGEVLPSEPTDFNKLPRDMDSIPTLTFNPVEIGEEARVALIQLCQLYTELYTENNPNGVVIRYFAGEGEHLMPYPKVPLWLFAAAVSVCSVFFSKKIRIQVASCLTVVDPDHESESVNCRQYCVVDGSKVPPVTMTNAGSIPANVQHKLSAINEIL